VLAVADAEVVEVRDEETVTGIATANLFRWNSVTLKVETRRDADDENDEKPNGPNGGDLYVEYVHVAARSACVAVGERVRRGQKICASGSVGFSPEPHLHFTAFRSRDPAAPTVRVRFAAEPRRRRRESEGTADAASAKSANASSDASSEDGATFLPVAGRWYDAAGEAPAPRDS
jgi:septal ring factor EnvC (AmiA/AmiB activator)